MTAPCSKHQIIFNYLINQIKNKELEAFDIIESEHELARKFEVSRMTVRKVIDELVILRFLYREQGKGTFVAERPHYKNLQNLFSFSEEARSKGQEVTSKIVDFNLESPSVVIKKLLKLKPQSKIWNIKRLRYIDDKITAFESSAYVSSFFGDCNTKILNGSIYKHLEKNMKLKISFANQEIEAEIAKKELAKLLEIKVGTPVLKISMICYLENSIPFEYTTTYYRTDRFKVTQSAFRNIPYEI